MNLKAIFATALVIIAGSIGSWVPQAAYSFPSDQDTAEEESESSHEDEAPQVDPHSVDSNEPVLQEYDPPEEPLDESTDGDSTDSTRNPKPEPNDDSDDPSDDE